MKNKSMLIIIIALVIAFGIIFGGFFVAKTVMTKGAINYLEDKYNMPSEKLSVIDFKYGKLENDDFFLPFNTYLSPYRWEFKYNNKKFFVNKIDGRWIYDEQEILTKLKSGENVLITAKYIPGDTTLPTPREANDVPLLDLYYKYDNDNKVGSFVMAAGFPENIKIESVGVAFYYKNADEFDPTDNFILLINNKMLVSRFNTDTLEDIYIVNINKMSSKYNWAARGYVTYYDETGKPVTAYSNQINIIDR